MGTREKETEEKESQQNDTWGAFSLDVLSEDVIKAFGTDLTQYAYDQMIKQQKEADEDKKNEEDNGENSEEIEKEAESFFRFKYYGRNKEKHRGSYQRINRKIP